MYRPSRKTRTFRRARANDARKVLDRYRRTVSDESQLDDLGELAQILANLVGVESGGRLRDETDMLFQAGRRIREAAKA